MKKFIVRAFIVVIAPIVLLWTLISTSCREFLSAVHFVWLDLQIEWGAIRAAWKEGKIDE